MFGQQTKMREVAVLGIAVLLFPWIAWAGQVRSTESQVGAEQPKLQRRGERYQLRPGDTLAITFPLTTEFDQKPVIQPDGYITLRGVGDLRAGGQTVPELTEAVKAVYARILHDPIVSVDLEEFEKPYFIVGGEVGRPDKYDLRSDTTAMAAIAIAGSFKETAKHSQVLLIRQVSDRLADVKVLNIKKMLQSRNLAEDPLLQSGDMLYVPQNAISKVKPFLAIFAQWASLSIYARSEFLRGQGY